METAFSVSGSSAVLISILHHLPVRHHGTVKNALSRPSGKKRSAGSRLPPAIVLPTNALRLPFFFFASRRDSAHVQRISAPLPPYTVISG